MAVTTADFASLLFASRTQAHIFHLQTSSYAEHKALGEYYDGIVDLVDGLIESCQGIHGKYTGYTNFELQDWVSTEDTAQYFAELYDAVQAQRKDLGQESWIQNQVDTISELIAHTRYLLTLK